MDFDLNEDQSLLRDSVERLAADLYPSLESRQARLKAPLGFPDAGWTAFVDLGVTGLPFPEAEGGFGGGPVETLLVMEAVGRNLVVEPLLASLVLGSTALRLGGSAAQTARLLPGVIDGSLRLTLAQTERQSRYDLHDVATTARRSGDGFVLSGAKSVVPNADAAGLMVVSARVSGSGATRTGSACSWCRPTPPGVAIEAYPTQDGGRAAEVSFSDVALPADAALGDPEGGLPLLERVVEHGIAALAAEAVGSMDALHRLTVEYLKTRKQFGVSVGSFQALQHRAVDMLIQLEQARSMALYAAMMVDAADARGAGGGPAAVKVQINKACRLSARRRSSSTAASA